MPHWMQAKSPQSDIISDVGDRGLVLLHELWHVQTGIISHPQELRNLLARYQEE